MKRSQAVKIIFNSKNQKTVTKLTLLKHFHNENILPQIIC